MLCFMETTHENFHFLLDEIQVASAFSASEMCEMEPWSVTCQKFAGREGKGREGGKLNFLLPLPSIILWFA
jgi:hypothetical protein